MKRYVTILLFVFAASFRLPAQLDLGADAILPVDKARIGEQLELDLKVHYTEGTTKSNVVWPQLKDTLAKGIEILKVDTIRTRLLSRSSVLYEQSCKITFTAFDSGLYVIPPIRFYVDGDSTFTEPVTFYMSTVVVDTTKPIRDIKDIYDVPAAPPVAEEKKEVNWYLWGGLAVLVVAIAAFLLWYLNRKKVEPQLLQPVRPKLPHERYLEMLDELALKKQWEYGDYKGFYVALTGIMRSWLAERYRIHALEMTTVEILRVLRLEKVNPERLAEIEQVLREADLVKFAKAIPTPQSCENSLQLSKNFVNRTAIIPVVVPVQPGISS